MSMSTVDDFVEGSSSNASGRKEKGSLRKTREELNDIEKQRTKRINQHIVALRNLLEMSNIATKKDKFSVLKNTYDYIVKLRQDILKLSRRPINDTYAAQSNISDDLTSDCFGTGNESLFSDANAAMVLASVDGQFLKCNEKFERLSGYSSRDITKVSIFNCTIPEEMNQLFNVIGTLLSQPEQTAKHFWKTCKFYDTIIETCFVSIWLVRNKEKKASFFQMMMVPLADCDGVWSSTGPMKRTAQPNHSTDKECVDLWMARGGPMGAMGTGDGVLSPDSANISILKKEDRENSSSEGKDSGSGMRGETSVSDSTLEGNLTEVANILANSGLGKEDDEDDKDWLPDDVYADITSYLTDDDGMVEWDAEEVGSNSVELGNV